MTSEITNNPAPKSEPTKPATVDLDAQRLAIEQRIKDLLAKLPQVRKDAEALGGRVGPIKAAQKQCARFVDGEHLAIQQLVFVASQASFDQTQVISQINSDLSRSLEMAGLFVAARAETWLRLETIAVAPAAQWAEAAQSQRNQFDKRLERMREWTTLKRPRWLPEVEPT